MSTSSADYKNTPKTKALLKKLIQVRKEYGYSQDQMAELLNLKGRHSYASVETGDKGLTLAQVDILIKEFPREFDSFAGISRYDSLKIKKYRQMILNMINFSVNTESSSIPKTKLAKLVYLADFICYYQKLEPMSGLPYIKLEHGPVAQAYFQILDDLEEEEIIVRKNSGKSILISLNEVCEQPKNLLEDFELRLIRKLAEFWRNRNTAEIVHFTHKQLPWQICNKEEIIPYGLITQEEPERIYGELKL